MNKQTATAWTPTTPSAIGNTAITHPLEFCKKFFDNLDARADRGDFDDGADLLRSAANSTAAHLSSFARSTRSQFLLTLRAEYLAKRVVQLEEKIRLTLCLRAMYPARDQKGGDA